MIYGFTIVKNAVTYDYPFSECVESLRSTCKETWIAHGDSDDETEKSIPSGPGAADVRVIRTIWDPTLRSGGQILSQQTNAILDALKREHSKGWGLYLQADEVLADWEIPQLKADLAKAEAAGCDAVSFRYFHFWSSFRKIAYAWRWYPQEIRAIRLDRPIESYGDAQSFRGQTKVFQSDVTVWHYGHVREAAAYEKKKNEFHRLWHKDEEIPKVIARGKKHDAVEPTLSYLGPHPQCMAARIERLENLSAPTQLPAEPAEVFVLGVSDAEFENLVKHVNGSVRLKHLGHWREALRVPPGNLVCVRRPSGIGGLVLRVLRPSRVPDAMASPQARPWPPEMLAFLRLSERGVTLRR